MNTTTHTHNQFSKACEMVAYAEAFKPKKSLPLAKGFLTEPGLDAELFNIVISTILASSDDIEPRKSWEPLIHTAYERLTKHDQKKVQFEMFYYHFKMKNWKTALIFIPSNTDEPGLLSWRMDACLAGGYWDQARKAFHSCRRMLAKRFSASKKSTLRDTAIIYFKDGQDPRQRSANRSSLLHTAATYCERVGKLDEAEHYWLQAMKLDEFYFQFAASGLVKIQIVRAWKHLLLGLEQIEKFRLHPSKTIPDWQLKNHDDELADAKKELETYREALEKIVPQAKLGRFGMNASLK